MSPAARERAQPTGETLRFMQGMWELVHALNVRSKRMARTLGVTGPQRLVLRLVGQNPNLTASEIAKMLGLHPSTLTGVLARLEAQKLLTRRLDSDDRRRQRFALTVAGRRIDHERKGTVEASVRRALAHATPAMIEQTEGMIALIVTELHRVE